LSELQFSILANLSGYVREGGVLVYSTCTAFHEEDEDEVERFLSEHPEFEIEPMDRVASAFIDDDKSEEFRPYIQSRYFKTFPPKNGMDGFFAARMVKHNRR
jgi:16S rRNA (cytosine967-C5)-methyltransferase